MSGDFYLTLPSNSSMDIFPDNKVTHFKTQFSKRILLHGDWEVGLVEIHYPLTFATIPNHDFFVLYEQKPSDWIKTDSDTESGGEEKIHRGKINFPGGVYASVESLIAAMKKEEEFREIADVYIYQSLIQIRLKNGVFRLILSISLQRIFGMMGTEIKDFLCALNPFDIEACNPSQMYLYTDIIEPQFVGDSSAPLLRIINIDRGSDVTRKHAASIFTHPHYMPVLKREFQQIELDIRDDLGYYLPFTHGRLNVKLHFRKLNNTV